jgi:xanthine/uracil permease
MERGGLAERAKGARLIVETLAWLVFIVSNTIPVPFVIGAALGLGPVGMASLTDRLFFMIGVTSLAQLLLGHRRPIMEGPGGMWWGVFVSMGLLAPALGIPEGALRSALEGGLVLAGLLGITIGAVPWLARRIVAVFSPALTGALLVLLTVEFAPAVARAMVGSPPAWGHVVTGMGAFLAILIVTLTARGILRSAGFLVGAGLGIGLALLLGVPFTRLSGGRLIAPPTLLAWGHPTLLSGVVVTSLVTGFLLISNLLATMRAWDAATGDRIPEGDVRRSILMNGVSNVLAGLFAVPGFIPYTSSAGFVSITGSRDAVPFVCAALVLIVLGLLPTVGHLAVAIPTPVVYAILLAAFAQILAIGMSDVGREGLDLNRAFAVTAPILLGIGIMALPAQSWRSVHSPLAFLAGNGLVVGLLGVLFFLTVVRLWVRWEATRSHPTDPAP